MKIPSGHTLDLAMSVGLVAALSGCEKPSPCLGAPEYDFSNNPEDTQAFYDDGVPLSSCYHPARNSTTPTLESTRIPLHFNILYYEGVEIKDIRAGIRRDLAALNYAFEPLDVTFYPAGITEMKDNGVPEFIESMNEDDGKENFDLRLSRQFMDSFSSAAGFPVFYFPKTNENDGLAGSTAPFIYYANSDYKDPWKRKNGYASTSSDLAHEIGHLLELKHPFHPDGKGDGLSDTLDYFEICDITMNDWSPYPVATSVEDDNDDENEGGVCYVGCLDSCGFKAPANVMDYFHCDPDVPLGFSPQQEQILNCTLQAFNNPVYPYVNRDLPKVDL